jgi:LEA14-like dessication related protein
MAVLGLTAVLVVALFAYQANRGPTFESIQVEALAPDGIVVQFGGVNMTIAMVVHNPNEVSGRLTQVNYSMYADGDYVGSGLASTTYTLPARSNYSLGFPIGMGWGPASNIAQAAYLGGGSLDWKLNGTVSADVGGRHFSTPFEYSSVFGF